MIGHAITIGDISLQDFEVPTCVQYGGRQRLVVHRMSDGTRSVEPLGPDDAEIQFQGTFSGSQAEARARSFNNLRLSGNAVWLTWQSFRYKVVVENFVAVYHSRWWITYRVSCVVVRQAGIRSSGPLTTQATISEALSFLSNSFGDTNIDVAALSAVLGVTGAQTAGTAAHSCAVAVVDGSMSQLQSLIDGNSGTLLNDDPDQGGASSHVASSFMTRLHGAGSLARAVNTRSYISLIGASLGTLRRLA